MQNLFKIISGSKLYGTNTPSSDTDYKLIYLPDIEYLLIGKTLKIKNSSNSDKANTSEDVDIEEIPLHKFIRDFANGQTYAIEIVFGMMSPSVKDIDVYYDYNIITDLIIDMKQQLLTSNIKSMIGYALSQSFKYGIKGKRIQIIKYLKDILTDFKNLDKNNSQVKLKDVVVDGTKFSDIVESKSNKYLKNVDHPCRGVTEKAFDLTGKIFQYDIQVNTAIYRMNKIIESYGSRAHDASKDGIDWKALYHAVRISDEAITLLEKGHLTFPFDQDLIDFYLSIKQGEIDFDVVKQKISYNLDKIDDLLESSSLQETVDSKVVDDLILKYLLIFYKNDLLNLQKG